MTWDGDEYQRQFDALADSGVDVHGEVEFVMRLRPNSVLDAGCGSGRVARELARRGIDVVGVDMDRSMLAAARTRDPGTEYHEADLAAFDLIVGADICFWEDLVAPLYQLVRHSVAAGVAEILVADPSRPPFDELCARCVAQGDAEVFTWTMTTPVADTGRILLVVGRGAAAGRAGRHAGGALDCTRS